MDEPNGLPFTRIGNRILIHIPTASEWIRSRMAEAEPATLPLETRPAQGPSVVSQRLMMAARSQELEEL